MSKKANDHRTDILVSSSGVDSKEMQIAFFLNSGNVPKPHLMGLTGTLSISWEGGGGSVQSIINQLPNIKTGLSIHYLIHAK